MSTRKGLLFFLDYGILCSGMKVVDETKVCSRCKKQLPATIEFFYVDKHLKSGLCSACKKCHSIKNMEYHKNNHKRNRKKKREYARRYYQQNCRGKIKAYHLKARYNLTLKQHQQMYLNQNGCCAICKIPVPYEKISTDHKHGTKTVRGLLCTNCNLFVGYIDNYGCLLSEALAYVGKC